MKVLAINGSPKMERGNTALLLAPFLEGMEEAGAEVELFYTKRLKIEPCQGEFNCWFKTPGKCFQKDDMGMLLSKAGSADVWIFATPVFCDGVTGPMKNLMDRMIPMVQPFFEMSQSHCRHPRREEYKPGKIVLVSNCGLWEMDNFDPLLVHMKAFCKNTGAEFAGALLRPHGEALRVMLKTGGSVQDIFDAAREAGRHLITGGTLPAESLNTISRELLPRDHYVEHANKAFQKALDNPG